MAADTGVAPPDGFRGARGLRDQQHAETLDYRLDGTRLTLYDDAGSPLLVFLKPSEGRTLTDEFV
jgi:hypothetical protein